MHAMKFSKQDFVSGHLDYVVTHFGVHVIRVIDVDLGGRRYSKTRRQDGVRIEQSRIDLAMLERLVSVAEPILYVDAFVLFGVHHYPHFITVLRKTSTGFRIFDPWDGGEKELRSEIIVRGIVLLRKHLCFIPQILIVTKDPPIGLSPTHMALQQ